MDPEEAQGGSKGKQQGVTKPGASGLGSSGQAPRPGVNPGEGGVILKLVLFVTQPRPPANPIPPKRDGGGIAADGSQGTYLIQTALGRGKAGDPRASSQVNLRASSLPSAGPNLPGSLPALHSSATPPRGWALCSKGCCFPSWPF